MFPLILVGVGYSIYAAAIWGSIPYIVKPHTVGTAFGIATAIQNIGLVIAPTLVGYIKDQTKEYDHGYHYVMVFFMTINLVGLILNICLYTIDIYQMGGILDRVDHGEPQLNEQHEQLK
jgi:MFS family permease